MHAHICMYACLADEHVCVCERERDGGEGGGECSHAWLDSQHGDEKRSFPCSLSNHRQEKFVHISKTGKHTGKQEKSIFKVQKQTRKRNEIQPDGEKK